MEIQLGAYIACICEGSAEQAIIDNLLDNHLLIFEREQKSIQMLEMFYLEVSILLH